MTSTTQTAQTGIQTTTITNNMSKKWQNLPHNLCNYATQLIEYVQKKEYNNESDDFMTFQMLSLKLKDINKNFGEQKVLVNFLPEEIQTIFKIKLLRYRTQFYSLKNEFSIMLEQIIDYKKQKKMLTPINLSQSDDTQHFQSGIMQQQYDSPTSKMDSLIQNLGQKRSIKTILLMLTSQFKENVRKIKPIYEEIVKITVPLIEKLQMSIQKQNQQNQQLRQSTTSVENMKGSYSSFVSQGSNNQFNSSNFSISSSTKSSESIENIMKNILQLAQTIKLQIREIEAQSQNLDEFASYMIKFKKDKVSFFDAVGSLEIYWMLRFDKVSTFFQQEISQLQKGMDIFLNKLKENIHKSNQENSSHSSSSRNKKDSQNQDKNIILEKQGGSRQTSISSQNQENGSEASSHTSCEMYYTARSLQYPRYKISEQIQALEQIPEEEQTKNMNSCAQSNVDHDFDSAQSLEQSSNNLKHSMSQQDMFSFNSNFQFITKPYESQKPQYKSILSMSDLPKDCQIQLNQQNSQIKTPTTQNQSFIMNRDFSKSILLNMDSKDSPSNLFKQSNSQQTASTKSQANPSGKSDTFQGNRNSNNQAISIHSNQDLQKTQQNKQFFEGAFCCNFRHV